MANITNIKEVDTISFPLEGWNRKLLALILGVRTDLGGNFILTDKKKIKMLAYLNSCSVKYLYKMRTDKGQIPRIDKLEFGEYFYKKPDNMKFNTAYGIPEKIFNEIINNEIGMPKEVLVVIDAMYAHLKYGENCPLPDVYSSYTCIKAHDAKLLAEIFTAIDKLRDVDNLYKISNYCMHSATVKLVRDIMQNGI